MKKLCDELEPRDKAITDLKHTKKRPSIDAITLILLFFTFLIFCAPTRNMACGLRNSYYSTFAMRQTQWSPHGYHEYNVIGPRPSAWSVAKATEQEAIEQEAIEQETLHLPGHQEAQRVAQLYRSSEKIVKFHHFVKLFLVWDVFQSLCKIWKKTMKFNLLLLFLHKNIYFNNLQDKSKHTQLCSPSNYSLIR